MFEMIPPDGSNIIKSLNLYYKLATAKDNYVLSDDKIWSQDTWLRDWRCGKCYTGMSAPTFYNFMCNDKICIFNWYKIFYSKTSSSFYLDIDLE